MKILAQIRSRGHVIPEGGICTPSCSNGTLPVLPGYSQLVCQFGRLFPVAWWLMDPAMFSLSHWVILYSHVPRSVDGNCIAISSQLLPGNRPSFDALAMSCTRRQRTAEACIQGCVRSKSTATLQGSSSELREDEGISPPANGACHGLCALASSRCLSTLLRANKARTGKD